jgi:hypothetical protein
VSQTVDPAVSLAKFNDEVGRFRAQEQHNAERGLWLLRAEFPIAEIAFVAARVRPATVVLVVRFDFTDFDVEPLSVKFVDPITRQELPADQLPTRMPRLPPGVPAEAAPMMMAQGVELPTLIQAYPGQTGFLCLPGVREYHANSAHTGDPWELHRGTGVGSMNHIVEKIWQYGSAPIAGMNVQFTVRLQPDMVPA